MTAGDYIALLSIAVVIAGGLTHLHVKMALVSRDVAWIKNALQGEGIIPKGRLGD